MTVYAHFPSGTNLGNIRAWLEFSHINTAGSYRESKERVEIASKDVMAGGDLNWEGILTSDGPLEFSTNIRFSEEGLWEITGYIEGDVGLLRSNGVKLAV